MFQLPILSACHQTANQMMVQLLELQTKLIISIKAIEKKIVTSIHQIDIIFFSYEKERMRNKNDKYEINS